MSPDIARGPDGDWVQNKDLPIRAHTVAQLKEFDIGRTKPGCRLMRQFPHQVPCDGSRIPTLDECAETIRELKPGVILNLEFKNDCKKPFLTPALSDYISIAVSGIRRLDSTDRIFVQGFDWRIPLGIREQLPGIRVGLTTDSSDIKSMGKSTGNSNRGLIRKKLGRDFDDFPDLPTVIAAYGAQVWSCDHRNLSQKDVKTAHELGLEVCVWTVNKEKDMGRMIEFQVDAITTDYPDRLVPLVASLPLDSEAL